MPDYKIPLVDTLPARGEASRRRVVVVTQSSARSLEYLGPVQVFDEANLFLRYAGREDLAYDVEFVSVGTGAIYDRRGFSISTSVPYHRTRGAIDTLMFQASDENDDCLRDERFLGWVAKMSTRVRRIVSICTGSFILAAAGVLDGRRAATHWCAVDDFRRRYPRVNLEAEPIYVKDGNVYTSAGATSGMDLAIALVEEDYGPEFARRVAQGLVMFLRRPGNQAQFSVQVPADAGEEDVACRIQAYIADHLSEDLRVDALAERFHMSPRNFSRVFARAVGVAPGRYVEQCRLERARQYLEETSASLGEISSWCGYATPDGLRLAFDRNLGVSPRAYRQSFSSSRSAGHS